MLVVVVVGGADEQQPFPLALDGMLPLEEG